MDGLGNAYYYHQDQLGSIRALTNSSGTVADKYSYDAYGNTTSSSGSVLNQFKYAGEYQDAESNLYYLRARYYDPATQQFLTVDPLVRWTEQAYAYVGGSPLEFRDPRGEFRNYTKQQAAQALVALNEGISDLQNEIWIQTLTLGVGGGLFVGVTGAALSGAALASALFGGGGALPGGLLSYLTDPTNAIAGLQVFSFIQKQLELFVYSCTSNRVQFWFEDMAGHHVLTALQNDQPGYMVPLQSINVDNELYDMLYSEIGGLFDVPLASVSSPIGPPSRPKPSPAPVPVP
jgi:RHS repeat-associated protein